MADSFVFSGTWAKAMAGLPGEVRLEVYDAVVRYGLTGETTKLKRLAGVAFEFIKQDMDANSQRKEHISNVRSKSASKKNFANVCKQTQAKKILLDFAETDEKSDSDSRAHVKEENNKNIGTVYKDNNNKKKENAQKKEKADTDGCDGEVDVRKFIAYFCSTMEAKKAVIPHRLAYTPRREAAVKARAREHGKEALKIVTEKAAESDFLNGKSGNSWLANFDWIFRPNNFVKVLEGNFDNVKTNSNGNNIGKQDAKRSTEATVHSAEDFEDV